MSTTEAFVSVRDLTVGYGRLRRRAVLRRLSMDLQPRTVTGLVGLNGVGKTTLLRALFGLLRPWSGHVRIAGEHAATYRRRHGIGYLPETLRLPPGMSVAGLLATGAGLAGLRGASAGEAVRTGLRMTDMEDHGSRRLSELSSGLARRAALAYALTPRPALVLLDEPTRGLDLRSRVASRRAIRAAGAEAAVVVSSHDLTELQKTADRVVVLDGGELTQDLGRDGLDRSDLEALLLSGSPCP